MAKKKKRNWIEERDEVISRATRLTNVKGSYEDRANDLAQFRHEREVANQTTSAKSIDGTTSSVTQDQDSLTRRNQDSYQRHIISTLGRAFNGQKIPQYAFKDYASASKYLISNGLDANKVGLLDANSYRTRVENNTNKSISLQQINNQISGISSLKDISTTIRKSYNSLDAVKDLANQRKTIESTISLANDYIKKYGKDKNVSTILEYATNAKKLIDDNAKGGSAVSNKVNEEREALFKPTIPGQAPLKDIQNKYAAYQEMNMQEKFGKEEWKGPKKEVTYDYDELKNAKPESKAEEKWIDDKKKVEIYKYGEAKNIGKLMDIGLNDKIDATTRQYIATVIATNANEKEWKEINYKATLGNTSYSASGSDVTDNDQVAQGEKFVNSIISTKYLIKIKNEEEKLYDSIPDKNTKAKSAVAQRLNTVNALLSGEEDVNPYAKRIIFDNIYDLAKKDYKGNNKLITAFKEQKEKAADEAKYTSEYYEASGETNPYATPSSIEIQSDPVLNFGKEVVGDIAYKPVNSAYKLVKSSIGDEEAAEKGFIPEIGIELEATTAAQERNMPKWGKHVYETGKFLFELAATEGFAGELGAVVSGGEEAASIAATGSKIASKASNIEKFAKKAGHLWMATNSAGEAYDAALKQGASNEEARTYGIATGVANYLIMNKIFGKTSQAATDAIQKDMASQVVENAYNPSAINIEIGAKDIAKGALKNAVSSGLKTGAQMTNFTVANRLTDIAAQQGLLGENSVYSQMYHNYINEGMPENEALKKLAGDLAINLAEEMGTSAISGFGFGAVSGVTNTFGNREFYQREANRINKNAQIAQEAFESPVERKLGENKYFDNVNTTEELNKQFKQYSKELHPDQNPSDAGLFSDISAEKTRIENILKGKKVGADPRTEAIYQWEEFVNKNREILGEPKVSTIKDTDKFLREWGNTKNNLLELRTQVNSVEPKTLQEAQEIQEASYDIRTKIVETSKAVAEATGLDVSTNIKFKPDSEYTPEQLLVKEEYIHAVDPKLKSEYEKAINTKEYVAPYDLGKVTKEQANAVNKILGFDISGYNKEINRSAFEHIYKRHGIEGEANKSLSNANDVSRIKYVLDDFDRAYPSRNSKGDIKKTKAARGMDGEYGKKIIFEKKIDGTYVVVEGIAENKKKKIRVVSAYTIKEGSQVPNVDNDPKLYVRNEVAQPSYSNNVTSQKSSVNLDNLTDRQAEVAEKGISNDMSDDAVKAMVVNDTQSVSSEEYANGFNMYYILGKDSNIKTFDDAVSKMDELGNGHVLDDISIQAAGAAFSKGKEAVPKSEVKAILKKKPSGTFKADFEASNMDEKYVHGVLENVAKLSGADVLIVENFGDYEELKNVPDNTQGLTISDEGKVILQRDVANILGTEIHEVVGHLGKQFAQDAYSNFVDIVEKIAREDLGIKGFDKQIKDLITEYLKAGQEISYEEAREEAIAYFAETMMLNPEVVEKFVKKTTEATISDAQKKNIIQTVLEWIKNAIKVLKDRMSKAKVREGTEGALREDLVESDEVVDAMIDVFEQGKKTLENTKATKSEKTTPVNKKYSFVETTPEEEQQHIDKLVEEYGTLEGVLKQWSQAGFITTDGQVLDFGHNGQRGEDHRAVDSAYADDDSFLSNSATENLTQFMVEGNIRVVPETTSLDFSSLTEPTNKQLDLVEEYIDDYAQNNQELTIEFSDEHGHSVDNKTYSGNINTEEVLNDIDRFYREGEIGGSKYSQFRYSLSSEQNGAPQILIDNNGDKIVIISEKIVTRNQIKRNYGEVARKINSMLSTLIGSSVRIEDNNNTVYFGKDLPGEYTYSKDTQYSKDKNKTAKMNAVKEIKHIISKATFSGHSDLFEEKAEAKKKRGIDATNGFDYYNIKFAIPVEENDYTIFSGILNVRIDKNNNGYVYDITKTSEIPRSSGNSMPLLNNRAENSDVFDSNNLSKIEKDVKNKKSISRTNEDKIEKYSQIHEDIGRQLKLVKGSKLDDKQTRSLALNLKKKLGSKMDTLEVSHQLNSLFTLIESKGGNINNTDVMDKAHQVVRDVTKEAKEPDPTYMEIVRGIRKTPIYLSEKDKAQITDYPYFRKASFGKFRFVNDNKAVSVDEFFKELEENHPDVYSSIVDKGYPDASTLLDVSNWIDAVKDDAFSLYDMEGEQAVDYYVLDLLNDYSNTKVEDITNSKAKQRELYKNIGEMVDFAKEQQKTINEKEKEFVSKLNQQQSDISIRLDEQKRELQDSYNKTFTEELSKTKEKYNEREAKKIAKLKAQQKERLKKYSEDRKRTEKRQSIRKTRDRVKTTITKPTVKKYIPKTLQRPVAELFNSIDLGEQYSISRLNKMRDNAMIKYQGRELEDKLSQIDAQEYKFTNKLKEFKDSLERYVKDAEDDSDTYFAPVIKLIEDTIDKVGTKSLMKMTSDELNSVSKTLRAIEKSTTERNRPVTMKFKDENGKKIETYEEAAKLANNQLSKTDLGKLTKAITSHLTGRNTIMAMGGWNPNSIHTQIANQFDDAYIKESEIKQRLHAIIDPVISEKKGKTQFTTKAEDMQKYKKDNLVDVGYKDKEGNPILLNHDSLVFEYLNLASDDNLNHLARGGTTFPDYKKLYSRKSKKEIYGNGIRTGNVDAEITDIERQMNDAYEDEDYNVLRNLANNKATILEQRKKELKQIRKNIEKELTDYDKRLIKAWKEVRDISTEMLNEYWVKTYGYENFTESDYWHIETDPNFIKGGDGGNLQQVITNLSESGAVISRQEGAGNPIISGSALFQIDEYINDVAKRIAYSGLQRDLNAVFKHKLPGYDNVQSTLQHKMPKVADNFVTIQQSIFGGRANDKGKGDRTIATLRGLSARSVLSPNLRVALAQVPSFLGTYRYTDAKAVTNAWLSKNRVKQSVINKYTPLMYARGATGFSLETADLLQDTNKLVRGLNKADRLAHGWIFRIPNKMDTWTVRHTFSAYLDYARRNYPDLEEGTKEQIENGESPLYKKAAELFNEGTMRTQPMFNVFNRNAWQLSDNEFAKTLTVFHTQPFQYLNLITQDIMEYKYEKEKGGKDVKSRKNKVLKSIASVLVANSLFVLMKLAVDKTVRHKDDEMEPDYIAEQLFSSYANMFILGSTAVDGLYNLIKNGRINDFEIYGTGTINALYDFAEATAGVIDGKSIDYKKNILEVLGGLGIPASNIEKDIGGVFKNIEDFIDNGEWDYSNEKDEKELLSLYILGDYTIKDLNKLGVKLNDDNKVRFSNAVETLYVEGEITKDEAFAKMKESNLFHPNNNYQSDDSFVEGKIERFDIKSYKDAYISSLSGGKETAETRKIISEIEKLPYENAFASNPDSVGHKNYKTPHQKLINYIRTWK